MCAWKRGTQNNQAGEIRKGHIKEFLQPSSRESSVSVKLKVKLFVLIKSYILVVIYKSH